jgi:hypothetical protein
LFSVTSLSRRRSSVDMAILEAIDLRKIEALFSRAGAAGEAVVAVGRTEVEEVAIEEVVGEGVEDRRAAEVIRMRQGHGAMTERWLVWVGPSVVAQAIPSAVQGAGQIVSISSMHLRVLTRF